MRDRGTAVCYDGGPASRMQQPREARGRRCQGESVSAIAVENVSKHWTTAAGQVRAVDGHFVRARAGTLNVLLGPSGCGKSTTLRLIAGLDHADAGRISIDGRDVTRLPPAQRNIAMVFQSYALFPHLAVAENIVFGLRVRKVGRRRSRAAPASASRNCSDCRRCSIASLAALRRPAAARRARSRDHRRSAGVPDGRAAVQPRCAAAPGNAPGDPQAAARARHHHGVRHARPGRGDVDGRPRDPSLRRPHRAERHAGRSLRDARRTPSSRASSARRR